MDIAQNIVINIILMLIIPLLITTALVILGRELVNKKISKRIGLFWYALVYLGIVLVLTKIGILTTIDYFPTYVFEQVNILRSVFNRIGLIWASVAFSMLMLIGTREMNRRQSGRDIIENRESKKTKLTSYKKVPLDYDKNMFFSGKNGAGKTAAIVHFIEEHMKNGEFTCVVDGKGDLGEFSLYDIVTKLAVKHNRPMYIINQSDSSNTSRYDPFYKKNATQIKDMLLNMSIWSEEFYKVQAGEYWQTMAEFMLFAGLPITFKNMTHLSDSEQLILVINTYMKDKTLKVEDKEQLELYKKVIERTGKSVLENISRFGTINQGIGKDLFKVKNTDKAFSLQQAFEENAVVLIVLNKLAYTEFARSLGLLVLDDIKSLIGTIGREGLQKKPFLCVYDELSVYFNDFMVDIINKSRSLGATNLLSTQTIADMDIHSENARRQIIGNMHGFYILKQADDKSAQVFADTIGTKKTVEITDQINVNILGGSTGVGTRKIVDEYKVNPNDLKELPLLEGYWIDTMSNAPIIRTKLPFIDVEGIPNYKITA